MLAHPALDLALVTSRTFAGQPLAASHPALFGQTDVRFTSEDDADVMDVGGAPLDAVFVAAEHGQSARAVARLDAAGYDGIVVDLSADFRFRDASAYPAHFGFEHPVPAALDTFAYVLPEIHAPGGRLPDGLAGNGRRIANPGCFATGLTLALWPLVRALGTVEAHVTALTGASGSGARPSATTHFPTRDGNVRAYKVLGHQHQPEVEQTLGAGLRLHFVPASGPWTRGIWGTAHIAVPAATTTADLRAMMLDAYPGADRAACGAVRLWDTLPELRASVGTPFCDLGVAVDGGHAVVGFALDNLLKGAASQAVQNLNLAAGFAPMAGLLPGLIRPAQTPSRTAPLLPLRAERAPRRSSPASGGGAP